MSSPGAGAADNRTRRVLVTGGAGFIGSHLTDCLLDRGDHVTVVDNLSTGRKSNLRTHANLRFIESDLDEALQSFGRTELFDEVYHLAAAVGVKLIVEDPVGSIETNVEQTAALLRFAASRASDRKTPVLIASSSEVYGKGTKELFAEDDDVVYGPTTVARWSYAASKAIDEYLALAYHKDHAMPTVIARFFNTVGPRQVGEYGMVLPRFVKAAVAGRELEVYGDGQQSRCFCDVRDVAGVLPRMLASEGCFGRVFNVGSDRSITMKELAELVIKVLGSASRIRLVPYSQAYGAGFEDLRRRRPDLQRIREAVGFEPRIALERTIRDLAADVTAASQPGESGRSHAEGGGVLR